MAKHRGGRQRREARPPATGKRQTSGQKKASGAREALKRRILDLLGSSDRGHKTRSLFSLLGRPLNYTEFCALLDEMKAASQLDKDELRRWVAGGPTVEITGIVFKTSSGSGYVQPDDGLGKVLLPRRQLDRLLHEDRVSVKVSPPANGGVRDGKLLALQERSLDHVVGRLARYGQEWALYPESLRFAGLVRVKGSPPSTMSQGDRIRAKLLPDPDGDPMPSALWVQPEVLLAAEPEARQLQESLKAEFNLPGEFESTVLAEAARHSQEDLQAESGRLDLRDACTFTIDPADAKDFDDALSISRLPGKGWELGVHIADVSWFVEEGGAMDHEARRRGCTVYLPGEAIPMLPHALSSGLCSLAEGVDRHTFSVIVRVGEDGRVRDFKVTPSQIRSRRRFAYEDVQALIDGKGSDQLDHEVADSLRELDKLWRLLKANRMHQGGLDFALPEAEFDLDETGMPLAVHARVSREANFLVEECMLLANRCVAELLSEHKRACVYRIHEEPGGEKLERFRKALDWLGVSRDIELKRVSDWQKLLASFKGLDEAPFLNRQVLRSMMKARYDVDNPGHFGLGFSHYAHFTSPIRRYPDLMIHRLLRRFLGSGSDVSTDSLLGGARNANQRELLAMEAERAATKIKQVLYLRERLGEEYTGVVSGVERFGVFVELDGILADALIPMADLPDDFWDLTRDGFEMRGRRSRRSFRIGDKVKIQVTRVDLEKREVDCRLAGDPLPERQS